MIEGVYPWQSIREHATYRTRKIRAPKAVKVNFNLLPARNVQLPLAFRDPISTCRRLNAYGHHWLFSPA
jgi:hypothetical protein